MLCNETSSPVSIQSCAAAACSLLSPVSIEHHIRLRQAGNVRVSVVVQYMVVYQLLVSLAVNTAFFVDGSWFSTHQVNKVIVMMYEIFNSFRLMMS